MNSINIRLDNGRRYQIINTGRPYVDQEYSVGGIEVFNLLPDGSMGLVDHFRDYEAMFNFFKLAVKHSPIKNNVRKPTHVSVLTPKKRRVYVYMDEYDGPYLAMPERELYIEQYGNNLQHPDKGIKFAMLHVFSNRLFGMAIITSDSQGFHVAIEPYNTEPLKGPEATIFIQRYLSAETIAYLKGNVPFWEIP